MEDYVQIGYTKKARGVDGEIKVFVEEHLVDELFDATVLFLEIAGGKVPFFIDYIREANDLFIKFEDVDDRQSVLKLTGKPVFLRKKDLSRNEPPPATEDYSFLEGFTISTKENGLIGRIEEVIEMPQQIMAIIIYRGKEVLIPLNDQFITGVDQEEGILEMELPEGLLDL